MKTLLLTGTAALFLARKASSVTIKDCQIDGSAYPLIPTQVFGIFTASHVVAFPVSVSNNAAIHEKAISNQHGHDRHADVILACSRRRGDAAYRRTLQASR